MLFATSHSKLELSVVTFEAACMLTSTNCPRPDTSRCSTAVSAAITANMLPVWNAWFPPPRTGGIVWSSYPQLHTGPAPASSVRSVNGSCARDVSRPKAVTDTQMSSGWFSHSESWSMPSAARRPGVSPSSTTSAPATSARNCTFASGSSRSRTTPRFDVL